MNCALAIAADNLNYATFVTYGGALCGVQQGDHGRVSSARQVCGKPTQLGRVIASLLDKAFCENTPSTVCRKYRYELLRLEKLKIEYEENKGNLKTQLRANRASQQLQRRQVLRLRSPSAESTGVSPAAKKTYRSVSAGRKELFPMVDLYPTDQ